MTFRKALSCLFYRLRAFGEEVFFPNTPPKEVEILVNVFRAWKLAYTWMLSRLFFYLFLLYQEEGCSLHLAIKDLDLALSELEDTQGVDWKRGLGRTLAFLTFLDVFFFVFFRFFFKVMVVIVKVLAIIVTPLGGLIYEALKNWWFEFWSSREVAEALAPIRSFLKTYAPFLWEGGYNTANVIAEAAQLFEEVSELEKIMKKKGPKGLSTLVLGIKSLKQIRGVWGSLCSDKERLKSFLALLPIVKKNYDNLLDDLSSILPSLVTKFYSKFRLYAEYWRVELGPFEGALKGFSLNTKWARGVALPGLLKSIKKAWGFVFPPRSPLGLALYRGCRLWKELAESSLYFLLDLARIVIKLGCVKINKVWAPLRDCLSYWFNIFVKALAALTYELKPFLNELRPFLKAWFILLHYRPQIGVGAPVVKGLRSLEAPKGKRAQIVHKTWPLQLLFHGSLAVKEISKAFLRDVLWKAHLYGMGVWRLAIISLNPIFVIPGYRLYVQHFRPLAFARRMGGVPMASSLRWPKRNDLRALQTYRQGPDNVSPIFDLPLIHMSRLGFLMSLAGPKARGKLYYTRLYCSVGVAAILAFTFYLKVRVPFRIAYVSYWKIRPKWVEDLIGFIKLIGPTYIRDSLLDLIKVPLGAVKALKEGRVEKSHLWGWVLGLFGLSSTVYARNGYTNPLGGARAGLGRGLLPFGGRPSLYGRSFYLAAFNLRSKLRCMLALAKDSLHRFPSDLEKISEGTSLISPRKTRWFKTTEKTFKHDRYFRPSSPKSSTAAIGGLARDSLEGALEGVRATWGLCKAHNLGRFPSFLWGLFIGVPGHILKFLNRHMVSSISYPLRVAFSVNQGLCFNTRKYFSYFAWKNTHPFRGIRTISTDLLHSPHWGLLRASITPMGLLRYSFFTFRFILISYRFKFRILPLLKAHVWLYYFYPLADIVGAYPSFLQPGPFLWEMSAGANFLAGGYCLVRAVKKALIENILRGKNSRQMDEALIEALELTLNPRSYWAPKQKLTLVDKGPTNSMGRPRYYDSSNFLDSFYSALLSKRPAMPPSNKSVDALQDRFMPRSKIRFEAPKPVRGLNLKNQGIESRADFFKAYHRSQCSPARWEERITNGHMARVGRPPKSVFSTHGGVGGRGAGPGWDNKLFGGGRAAYSPELKSGNSPAHGYFGVPNNLTKRASLSNRPEEAFFFNKRKSFSFNQPHPQGRGYRGKPLSSKTSRFYDHYNQSPTNSFLIKEKKKRGSPLHHEAHPGLKDYWGKSGLKTNEISVDGVTHPNQFRLPTHSSHEFRGALLDLLHSLESTLWVAGSHLKETLSCLMVGPEVVGMFVELAIMPLRLAGAVCYSIIKDLRLDLIPDLGLQMDEPDLNEFLNPKDAASLFSIIPFILYIWSIIAFFFGVGLKCLKFSAWWITHPNNIFLFSWAGAEKIGRALLFHPSGFPLQGPLKGSEPPTFLIFKWFKSVFWFPLLNFFFEPIQALPTNLKSIATSMGKEEHLKEHLRGGGYFHPSGWPISGSKMGIWDQAISVCRDTFKIICEGPRVEHQAWIIPVWAVKLFQPEGWYLWDYFVPVPNRVCFDELREDGEEVLFQLEGVILYDDHRDEVLLPGEEYIRGAEFELFSWSEKIKEIEEKGILNVELGFLMDEFIVPFLYREEVLKGVELGIDLDLSLPTENSEGQTSVRGDLLDWASSTGVFTGATLVWVWKNLSHLPPYGFIEPLGGRLSYLSGVKDFSIKFFRDPQRKWGGGFADSLMVSCWTSSLVGAFTSFWKSPVSLLQYYFPFNGLEWEYLEDHPLFTIYDRVFNLVCAAAFLSPFLSFFFPNWGPFVAPLTPSPSYGFFNKAFIPDVAEVGKFKWLNYIFHPSWNARCPKHYWDFEEGLMSPHTVGECPLAPEITGYKCSPETLGRLEMLFFALPYVKSTFSFFKDYQELNNPPKWLDNGVFHSLSRLTEYSPLPGGGKYLKGALFWGSTFFLWPDFFNPLPIVSLGWPIDFVVSVARGVARFHIEIWYWDQDLADIDPFAIDNDVDLNDADYYHRQKPIPYKW